MFDYIAAYMYEGDAPLVDRRAQALALDRDLLRELLGAEELRELLDARRPGRARAGARSRSPATGQAGSADAGARPAAPPGRPAHATRSRRACAARTSGRATAAASEWLEALAADRRAVTVRISGEERWIATEDVARYRDALGVVPPGRRAAGVPDARRGCARRAAAALGAPPWSVPGRRTGRALGSARSTSVETELEKLLAAGTLLRGEFRPDGVEREWCHPDVLRLLRRRSLAQAAARDRAGRAARAGPVPAQAGRASASAAAGIDRLAEVIAQLEGTPLPASVLERDVLPARVARLLAAAARRARRGGRGRLGRPRLAGPGRRPGRALQARPTAPAAARRRARLPLDPDDEGAWLRDVIREHLRVTRRLVLPRHPGRGTVRGGGRARRARAARARAARRAVGPGLGHGGHQRHVRATARAALAAQRLRPPHGRAGRREASLRERGAHGPAGSGRALVAGQ